MDYNGHRPILPQQNANEWTHNLTGEVGKYSNWQLQSETNALDGAPENHHVPGTGRHPGNVQLSQQFRGVFEYNPMEVSRFSHGGQKAPYLRHEHWKFHGVAGSEIFHENFGHDGTRLTSTSRVINRGQFRVPSAFDLDDAGHARRPYGEGLINHGPVDYYIYQGVGDDVLDGAGGDDKQYGFGRVNEQFPVPSAKAL